MGVIGEKSAWPWPRGTSEEKMDKLGTPKGTGLPILASASASGGSGRGHGIFRFVPERGIGVAIEVEVGFGRENPLLADGPLPLAKRVFKIPGGHAGGQDHRVFS